MSLTNPNTPVSQQDLQDFYHKILPYMGGSSGGGGHTIEDAEGTDLTQRDTLQFGEGFKAEDDDTNKKTVISPDVMQSGDMGDVITPLPTVQPRYQKYSTEEQIVGEWIDGKPLYQKTLANLTTPSSTDDWFVIADLSALNIDTFVDIYGRLIAAPSFNVSIPSLWSISTSLNSNFNFGYSDEDKKLHGTVLGPNWLNRPYFLTIQYTKTTD